MSYNIKNDCYVCGNCNKGGQRYVRRMEIHKTNLGAAFFDLNGLKQVNDEQMYEKKRAYYGESGGDNDRRGKRCI